LFCGNSNSPYTVSDADIKYSSGTVVINGLTIGKSEPLYNSGKFIGSWA